MKKKSKQPQTRETRRRIFVDPQIQLALLKQLSISWITVLAVVACVLLTVESCRAGFNLNLLQCAAAMWSHNGAVMITLVILAPIVIYDSLKLSHRLVGPMVSFRRELNALSEGEPTRPLKFRDGDFWCDLADRFNKLAQRVEQLEQANVSNQPEADMHQASETEPVASI